jgi:hypothetical protein
LRLASRFNWSALLDKGPHAYWYRIEEAVQDFERARFRIRAVATDAEIDRNIMVSDYRKLAAQNAGGAFYCICDKP